MPGKSDRRSPKKPRRRIAIVHDPDTDDAMAFFPPIKECTEHVFRLVRNDAKAWAVFVEKNCEFRPGDKLGDVGKQISVVLPPLKDWTLLDGQQQDFDPQFGRRFFIMAKLKREKAIESGAVDES